jgi:lipopolysaccharide transport system ATP-binding protein
MTIAIKIENLSKQYRLGLVSTRTLSHDLNRWWQTSVLGKDDPYLKISDVTGRTRERADEGSRERGSEYIWALKDINLEVQQGEVLGIIGKNGAGKSTLLKILSKITAPTTGSVFASGRIASLLEVGTGFHPEMTGRENIFMNGAIMGMTKAEITRKLDEIVDFAGVERYIDTPVKRYSSGMTVRLGFAVAAHLEPGILVVDEVLAVGDAGFQEKAVGKMHNISHNEGRTILFVSHNMTAVKALCNYGIVLENGKMIFRGKSEEAVSYYLRNKRITVNKVEYEYPGKAPGNQNIRLKSFSVRPIAGDEINIDSGMEFCLEFYNQREGINLDSTFELLTLEEIKVFHHGCTISREKDSKRGLYRVVGHLPPFLLNAGIYKFNLIFGENQFYTLFAIKDILTFEVENTITDKGKNLNKLPGIIFPKLNWKYEFIEDYHYE